MIILMSSIWTVRCKWESLLCFSTELTLNLLISFFWWLLEASDNIYPIDWILISFLRSFWFSWPCIWIKCMKFFHSFILFRIFIFIWTQFLNLKFNMVLLNCLLLSCHSLFLWNIRYIIVSCWQNNFFFFFNLALISARRCIRYP